MVSGSDVLIGAMVSLIGERVLSRCMRWMAAFVGVPAGVEVHVASVAAKEGCPGRLCALLFPTILVRLCVENAGTQRVCADNFQQARSARGAARAFAR